MLPEEVLVRAENDLIGVWAILENPTGVGKTWARLIVEVVAASFEKSYSKEPDTDDRV